jgi:hypothetical protein
MAFPTNLDSFTTKNAGDTISQTHVNDLQTSVISIEEKLGSGTPSSASTNTALLGIGNSSTGYQVISLANSTLVTGTLTSERGGTGTTTTNSANGAVILNASSKIPVAQLGSWVDKSGGYAAQQATTDGFVVARILWTAGNDVYAKLEGYTDANANPVALIAGASAGNTHPSTANVNIYTNSFTLPVKKNDYWKVVKTDIGGAGTYTISVYWIPLGA